MANPECGAEAEELGRKKEPERFMRKVGKKRENNVREPLTQKRRLDIFKTVAGSGGG